MAHIGNAVGGIALSGDLPRIVCLDCMTDAAVLYRDDYDPARRADLVRVKCCCADVFVWVHHLDAEMCGRPVILADCSRASFDQGDLEGWERLATQAMKRCAEVQKWFKETGR
jgi:hypothetical protein